MNEFAIAIVILLVVAVMEAVLNVKLYKHAQRACEIRSNMLQKITDLERCAQAHEAWIAEQEEKQWKD